MANGPKNDTKSLDRLAEEELLRESKRARERSEVLGIEGFRKCPVPRTNKRFLLNTIVNNIKSNNLNKSQELKTRKLSLKELHKKCDKKIVCEKTDCKDTICNNIQSNNFNKSQLLIKRKRSLKTPHTKCEKTIVRENTDHKDNIAKKEYNSKK